MIYFILGLSLAFNIISIIILIIYLKKLKSPFNSKINNDTNPLSNMFSILENIKGDLYDNK